MGRVRTIRPSPGRADANGISEDQGKNIASRNLSWRRGCGRYTTMRKLCRKWQERRIKAAAIKIGTGTLKREKETKAGLWRFTTKFKRQAFRFKNAARLSTPYNPANDGILRESLGTMLYGKNCFFLHKFVPVCVRTGKSVRFIRNFVYKKMWRRNR